MNSISAASFAPRLQLKLRLKHEQPLNYLPSSREERLRRSRNVGVHLSRTWQSMQELPVQQRDIRPGRMHTQLERSVIPRIFEVVNKLWQAQEAGETYVDVTVENSSGKMFVECNFDCKSSAAFCFSSLRPYCKHRLVNFSR